MTGRGSFLLLPVFLCLLACGTGNTSLGGEDLIPAPLSFCEWDDLANNPLIEPPPYAPP